MGVFGNKIMDVFISTVSTPASRAEGKSTPIFGVGVVLIFGGVVVNVFTLLISVFIGKLLIFEINDLSF